MKRLGNSFVAVLRSPHSAPQVGDQMWVDLVPHALGGFVLAIRQEQGGGRLEGFATAHDLRELSAMFAAAAAVLEARAAA